ncbi:hypothetical protein AB0K09_27585, partial [Streptomyces sp. NPDC049577]
VARLLDEEPEQAYAYSRVALRLASRVAAVREAWAVPPPAGRDSTAVTHTPDRDKASKQQSGGRTR